jgi:AAA+ ATPase superfamily predicted ATPase
MENLVLDPMGVLHNEPRRLLLDDLRETTQAASVLSLIGQGCNRLSEIAARLGKPATSLTRPLTRLLDLGMVRREQPFGAPPRSGKKSLYKIDDPFLAFWFRYVEPNRSRLEAGVVTPVARAIDAQIEHHRGEIWDDLARRAVPHLSVEGIEWGSASRWWGTGLDRAPLEIDIVAESVDGRALLVGEVKLSLGRKAQERARNELARKVDMFPDARNYEQVVQRLFVVDPESPKPAMVVSGKAVLPTRG